MYRHIVAVGVALLLTPPLSAQMDTLTSWPIGSRVRIEKGDTHEIRNTGRALLKTLNVYVPPAYTKDGDELPRGRK